MRAIILAAGKSTRFKSKKPKVLHDLLGKSILERTIGSLAGLDLEEVVVVVGHQADAVSAHVREIGQRLGVETRSVLQAEQKGTAHALQIALESVESNDSDFVVICGDTPLCRQSSIEAMIAGTEQFGMISAIVDDPHGYGRLVRDKKGQVSHIIEQKDTDSETDQINQVNSGINCVKDSAKGLLSKISKLNSNNAQGEFYLTHLVEQYEQVYDYQLEDNVEMMGINTKAQLREAARELSDRRIGELEDQGVIFYSPETCMISPETEIGMDTIVHGHTYIFDKATIGEDCIIGPFARIRGGVSIGDRTLIGNFVELKNTNIGADSFASHLSYLGDAELGDDVNIGAGTITANFNAITGAKTKSELSNHVKTGANSVLVSPLKVAEGAYIAAGSTVSEDVEDEYSLVIARERQIVKKNWVKEKSKSDNK